MMQIYITLLDMPCDIQFQVHEHYKKFISR